MRISDWSSDVCSSDLTAAGHTHSQPCRLGIDVRLLHARSAAAGACRLGGAPGLSARCNRAALLLCPGNPVKSIACPTRFASFLEIGRASVRERVCLYV